MLKYSVYKVTALFSERSISENFQFLNDSFAQVVKRESVYFGMILCIMYSVMKSFSTLIRDTYGINSESMRYNLEQTES